MEVFMTETRIKLRNYQEKAVQRALYAFEHKKFLMIEAETGTGKTTMFTQLALRLHEQKKRVIISTYSNQLALDIADKIGGNISISAGIENYFDPAKLDSLYLYTSRESIDKYISHISSGNDYLIFKLLDAIGIEDKDKIIAAYLIKANKRQPYMNDIDNNADNNSDIIVTNHSYLLTKLMRNKLFDISKYHLLIDEANSLVNAANMLTGHSFSLYQYRNITGQLLSDMSGAQYRGVRTDRKILEHNYHCSKYLMNRLKNSKDKLAVIHLISANLKPVNIKRIADKTRSRYAVLLSTEQAELNYCATYKPSVLLMLSAEFGYPSIKIAEIKQARFLLQNVLWNKTKLTIGTSATLQGQKNSIKQPYNILGITDNYLPLLTMRNNFKKNADIIMPKITDPVPSHDKKMNNQWIEYVAGTLLDTYDNKNSLIIAGGYDEVKQIYKSLINKNPNLNIIYAVKGVSTVDIISQFKRTGGILIGTRAYKTGIDLPGTMLERLYLAKIPFPVLNSPEHLELMQFNKYYANAVYWSETVMGFRQAIGRLIRTPEDTGKIYILDPRIYTHNRFSTLSYFAKRIGKIVQNKPKNMEVKYVSD